MSIAIIAFKILLNIDDVTFTQSVVNVINETIEGALFCIFKIIQLFWLF